MDRDDNTKLTQNPKCGPSAIFCRLLPTAVSQRHLDTPRPSLCVIVIVRAIGFRLFFNGCDFKNKNRKIRYYSEKETLHSSYVKTGERK